MEAENNSDKKEASFFLLAILNLVETSLTMDPEATETIIVKSSPPRPKTIPKPVKN